MGAFLCLLEQAEEMEAIVPNGGSSMNRTSGEARAIQVSVVTIVGNVVLTILKLAAGIAAHSGAMVSDAVHSASDVLSTFVVIAGVKLAGKEPR